MFISLQFVSSNKQTECINYSISISDYKINFTISMSGADVFLSLSGFKAIIIYQYSTCGFVILTVKTLSSNCKSL